MIFNMVGGGAGGSGGIQIPDFTYDGDYYIVNDSGEEWVEGNWKAYLLTSGTFTPNVDMALDVFCVGGGGSGGSGNIGGSAGGGGGGGGYTHTEKSVLFPASSPIVVSIGSGGAAVTGPTNNYGSATAGKDGSQTSFGSIFANGATKPNNGGFGGAGGSGGGGCSAYNTNGGTGGSNGGNGATTHTSYPGGAGQGYPTTEFGEDGAIVYSGGGGGAGYYDYDDDVHRNGGNGGAGGSASPATGGGTGGTRYAPATDPVIGGASSKGYYGGGGGGGYGGGGGGCNGASISSSVRTSGAGCQGIVVIRNARALVEE